MKIYKNLNDLPNSKSSRAVAIGIFDGVHLAHQKILKQTLAAAKKLKIKSCVLTFHPHPETILRPDKNKTPYLMSPEHRYRLISQMGFDEVLVLKFDLKFSKMSAEDFVEKILHEKLQARFISIGHDFRFGSRAIGDSEFLKQNARRFDYKVWVSKKIQLKGVTISSTQIREYVGEGQLLLAQKMLGRPVSIYGTVVHGHKRGSEIGFKTANLDPHHEALPPQGVYACYAFYKGKRLNGVVNVGPKPTFLDQEPTIEVHLMNFDKKIYQEELELFFVKKLRSVQKFASVDQLKKAIEGDIKAAQRILTR